MARHSASRKVFCIFLKQHGTGGRKTGLCCIVEQKQRQLGKRGYFKGQVILQTQIRHLPVKGRHDIKQAILFSGKCNGE